MLQRELLDLAAEDGRVRAELIASGELFDGYHPRMAAVHSRNAKTLDHIISEWGWPGRSLVGDDGAEAAWLVLQHAIGHPELLRNCLPLLQTAAEAGDVPASHPAYLEDRICCFEDRPQPYGTQLDWDENGELSPLPLQDAERVDELRAAVGLEPLSDRVAEARREAKAEGATPPPDFDQWQRKKTAWAKSAGWLSADIPG